MAWNLKNGYHERMMSEINITPLTDVMLVLLVIFMVTTPLIMVESFKIKLPKAASASAEPGKGAVISITENGLISMDGKEVTLDGLYEGLKDGFGRGAERTVVVKADGATMHRVIIDVLDTAKQAGAEKLSIATERDDKKGR